jgi:uncharacterized protein (TIGR03086 family)
MSTEALERAVASTAKVLQNVSKDKLGAPTPCASWTVSDVVNHILVGQYWFAAVVEHGDTPADFDGGQDLAGGDINATFADGSSKALAAFGAPGALEKTVKLPWGEMPAAMFINIAAQDTFVHGWDVARAIGDTSGLDEALAEQFVAGAKALPDAFRGPDGQAPFGPVADCPDSAPASDRLAAALGRKV